MMIVNIHDEKTQADEVLIYLTIDISPFFLFLVSFVFGFFGMEVVKSRCFSCWLLRHCSCILNVLARAVVSLFQLATERTDRFGGNPSKSGQKWKFIERHYR